MSSQAVCDALVDVTLLPVEILAHIFRAACCADAGFHLTLRLVSRLCRDIARPLKYCSMFIQGPEHLHFIVQQLTQYPTNIPLVEHVAFTDHLHRTRRDVHRQGTTSSSYRHFNMKMHMTACPYEDSPYEEMFARDVCTFFDMVAPTLRTLHVSFYSLDRPLYFEIFRPNNARTYPRLEEIAYRPSGSIWPMYSPGGDVRMEAGGGGIIPARTGRTIFPRLRRLWFSGATHYGDMTSEGFFDDLAMACPGLTHLRLHEPDTNTLGGIVSRFMHWHGVQLGEKHQLPARLVGPASWFRQQRRDTVAVLQSNVLLGFPHLQRLIIDLETSRRRPLEALNKACRDNLCAISSRRQEVVIRNCYSCKGRARVPVSFARDLFEKSVGGHLELWDVDNEEFQEDEAKRWQPIRVGLPAIRPLMYRSNIDSPLLQAEG